MTRVLQDRKHLYEDLKSPGPRQLTHTININVGTCTSSEVVVVSFYTEFQGDTIFECSPIEDPLSIVFLMCKFVYHEELIYFRAE